MATVAPPDLTADILAGNLRKSVSIETYNRALADTFSSLLEKNSDYKSVKFDPNVHLKFYAQGPLEQHKFHNTRRITMEELGLTHKLQISPIGVSDPFPLFTDEAVDIMRMEVLQKDAFLKHARTSHTSTSGLDCVLRGWVSEKKEILTPFTYAAWTHPKTMELVSTMAGVELEIVMDYEIAHVNIGITDPKNAAAQCTPGEIEKRRKFFTGESSDEDIPAIVGWHKDSYPFVCVLMLSDTTQMIGGETYLRMGDSKLARVSGPQRGNAAMLQGRLINHLAPKPLGATERITMVTSYRAKNPTLHDGSVLATVKPEVNYGSRYDEFYRQWVTYRADVIKARLAKLTSAMMEEESFNKHATTDALKEIESYLRNTYKEMEMSGEEWSEVVQKG
ncbi:hypothetical protein JCM33374_g636 [Metschnikowia sp. JCM 33374]|nr:hypothetical protein JCM33374_g636 [Metschnikowia sp. JCM 33374]